MSLLTTIIVLVSNFWIWRIFENDKTIALILFILTILTYKVFFDSKIKSKLVFFAIFILGITLLYQQITTTKLRDMVNLSNDEIRLKDMRMREYPFLNFPLAHWIEERKESIYYFRFKENISEVVDINLYFFANHPRSRHGYTEFEKFHFAFIPFYLLGLLSVLRYRKSLFIIFCLLFPVLLIGFIGNINPMGPFVLLPFFVITISQGIIYLWKNIKKH